MARFRFSSTISAVRVYGWEENVRRAIWLLLAIGLTWSVTGCIPTRLKQAQKGLAATIAGLPEGSKFSIAASISGKDYDTDYEVTCYWSSASIAVGTHLPKEEALVAYIQELQRQGWTIWRDRHETEKSLIRGEYEEITVSSDPLGWQLKENEDYKSAQEAYPTFLRVSVQYFLPSRKDCLGE